MTKPIIANQYQSLENASIFIFFFFYNNSTGIDPKKTLKKAIVIGPKDSVAILILKKADAHIKAKITNKV